MAALALGSWPLGLFVEPEALLLGYVPSFARSSVVQSVLFPHDLLPSSVGPACQLLSTSASHICSHLHVSEVFCVTSVGQDRQQRKVLAFSHVLLGNLWGDSESPWGWSIRLD